MAAAQPGEPTVVARELLHKLDDMPLALYGSRVGGGAERLWLVVHPDVSPRQVRDAFFPIWQHDRPRSAGGPLLGTPADIAHYVRILPQEVAAFRAEARLLHGDDMLALMLAGARPDVLHSLAWLADETLIGSALVASPDEDWRQTTGSTLRHSERLLRAAGRAQIQARSPEDALVRLHAFLAAQHDRYPAYAWGGEAPADPPPRHLPGLLALVGWGERLVVVLPRVDEATFTAIDWRQVADLVTEEFETILVATPWQLRLVASVAEAVSLIFRSFERVWGADILAGCRPSEADVRLSAAVLPVRTLVERLPADYLTADESGLANLIHAVQNVLQNIQMRSELWARISGVDPRRPPDPLPGRETPAHQRVEALFGHLRWWTERWAGSALG